MSITSLCHMCMEEQNNANNINISGKGIIRDSQRRSKQDCTGSFGGEV